MRARAAREQAGIGWACGVARSRAQRVALRESVPLPRRSRPALDGLGGSSPASRWLGGHTALAGAGRVPGRAGPALVALRRLEPGLVALRAGAARARLARAIPGVRRPAGPGLGAFGRAAAAASSVPPECASGRSCGRSRLQLAARLRGGGPVGCNNGSSAGRCNRLALRCLLPLLAQGDVGFWAALLRGAAAL